MLKFVSVFLSLFDFIFAIDSAFLCPILPTSRVIPPTPIAPPLSTLFFSLPPFPSSPLRSLSLYVNENVLTREKDPLGMAQFIRKAEVWRKKKKRKKK